MRNRVTWVVLALLLGCFVTIPAAWGVSLMEAVEQSAKKITEELPPKSRVAIVAFESPNGNLSEYIMDELTGALVERGMEVADRRNLEYVKKELKFQLSGEVDEKTAQSIGKFLGAQMVITGQLILQGKNYRYRTSAVRVEKATLASITRLDVENDRAMKNLITAMEKQKTTVQTPKYGVDEKAVPKTAGTFLDRGILFATRGDYELAIMDFSEAIKLEPNLVAAYMLRGRALYASVSKVIGQGDNFSSVNTVTTGGKTTTEKVRIYDLAIVDFSQAIRLDPNNITTYRERGSAYADKGDYDNAIADYNQVIRLDPDNDAAYNNRGLVYANKGDYDRAITDLTQAIKLNPNIAILYHNRGSAYAVKKDYDRAIADFTQRIKLESNNADAYYNRGVVYGNRGSTYADKRDYDRAITDLTQAIKLNPNHADAYYSRSSMYANKGDYDKAITDCTQVIKLDPNDADAYFLRGRAYSFKKDYDRAIADYNQAIKLKPNLAYAYHSRGVAYWWKNDLNRAIADFEAALRINPNDTIIRKNLEDARQARGY